MPFDASKHLIRVRGNREYLPVAGRLVWFREEHPDWSIETEIVTLDAAEGRAVFRASIRDTAGRVMSQATKMETVGDFPDYMEKAETGAIGRALALCGYGTQFAPELEEGERVADAPRGGGGDAGGLSCEGSDCLATLTVGQAQFSVKTFGKRLCPECQRKVGRR